jgi:hypothetical protein
MGQQEIHNKFWLGNLLRAGELEDRKGPEKIVLKYILEK